MFTKIKNVVITSPLAVDSVITSVKATDPDQSQVFYSIVWIHSKLLGKNATTPDYIKSDCSCHVRGVCSTPRNYLCISNTGDISISSAFKQEPGEVLSVMVMVSDSGNPKRYTYRLLTVTVFDPCGRTKDLYKRLNNTYCLRSLLALHMQISETKLSQTNALFYTHTSGMQVDKILYMVINFAKFTIPSGTARILISVKQRLPDGSFGRVINIGRLYNSTERFTQIPLDFYVTAGQMVEVAVIAQRLVPTLPPASTSVSSQTATPSEAMDLRISISPISSFRSSFFIESSESKYLPKKATTASTFMHSSVSQLSIESSESKYLPTKATTASIFMQASVSQLSIKSNESNYLPTKVTTASIFTQASVSQHTSKAKPSQSSSASQYMQLPNPINSISIEPSTSHHLTMILATTSISFKASVSLHSVSEMLLKTQSVSRNISLPVATGSNALPSAVGQYNSTTHSTPLLKQGLESSISTLAGYKSPIFVKASGLHPLSMVSDTTAADVTSVSLAVVNPSSASSQRPAISSFSTGFGGGLILTERPPRGVPMPLKIIDQGNSGGSTVQVSSLANVSLSLSYDSVKLYGFSFKSYCGKSHCVNSYIEWKNVTKEAKRNGHAECGKDPQSIQDFYEECLSKCNHVIKKNFFGYLSCLFIKYSFKECLWTQFILLISVKQVSMALIPLNFQQINSINKSNLSIHYRI